MALHICIYIFCNATFMIINTILIIFNYNRIINKKLQYRLKVNSSSSLYLMSTGGQMWVLWEKLCLITITIWIDNIKELILHPKGDYLNSFKNCNIQKDRLAKHRSICWLDMLCINEKGKAGLVGYLSQMSWWNPISILVSAKTNVSSTS